MRMNQRQIIIAVALLLTIIATVIAPPLPETEVVEAKSVDPTKMTSTKEEFRVLTTKNNFNLIEKRIWVTEENGNLFDVKRKDLPPIRASKPPVRLPPPKPTAPPLPFTYVGKLIDKGGVTVFLEKQQRNYLIKGGEVLDGTYRVDKADLTKVVFTYLPFEEEQVMNFGEVD